MQEDLEDIISLTKLIKEVKAPSQAYTLKKLLKERVDTFPLPDKVRE